MKQTSFASLEYAGKKRQTRREKFLGEMDKVVPWSRLEALIEPHYPKSGKVGRPPIGVPRMLRMYFLQQWYTLADEALEDALYDSQAMRDFVGIDLAREQVPDATTLLKFRRLLEQHDLTGSDACRGQHSPERARPADAPRHGGRCHHHSPPRARPRTTRRARPRDAPDQKGQQLALRHEDAHRRGRRIGADPQRCTARRPRGRSWRTRMNCCTAQEELGARLTAGYAGRGQARRDHRGAARAAGSQGHRWDIAMKRGDLKAMPEGPEGGRTSGVERQKAQVRAIVEHPFHVIKNLFGYRKVSYRGLAKNHVRRCRKRPW